MAISPGIKFLAASGSVTNTTVDGISHGNGVQEGKGILVDNRTHPLDPNFHAFVTLDNVTVTNFQKAGVDIRGDVNGRLTNSVVGQSASPSGVRTDKVTAANSVVVAYGANAVVSGNTITGNDWDGNTDWNATALLGYQAGNLTVSNNVFNGPGTDIGVDVESSAAVVVTCNLIGRSAEDAAGIDVWDTGLLSSGNAAVDVEGNTFAGWRDDTAGVVNHTRRRLRSGGSRGQRVRHPHLERIGQLDACHRAALRPGLGLGAGDAGRARHRPARRPPRPSPSPACRPAQPRRCRFVRSTPRVSGARARPASPRRPTSVRSPWPRRSWCPPLAAGAVSGIAVSNLSDNGFNLTWNPANGATSYEVTVGGVVRSVSDPSIVVTGLTPSTPYLVTSAAHNAQGNGTAGVALAVTSPAAGHHDPPDVLGQRHDRDLPRQGHVQGDRQARDVAPGRRHESPCSATCPPTGGRPSRP